MQEILRTWREFEASPDDKTTETPQNYPTLEIRIPVEYVASTNRQVSDFLNLSEFSHFLLKMEMECSRNILQFQGG